MNEKQYEILGSDTIYNGFFRLEKYNYRHTLYKGGWSKILSRELFRRGSCVAVLLYDPELDEVVVIEQFRVGAMLEPGNHAWLLEIVAGGIEEGESAADVAHREAEEEAGCKILELTEIMQFYTTPGGFAERISLFYGRVDCSKIGGIHGLQEEDEDILVKTIKAEQVFQMLDNGEIESAIPILAFQWLYINRHKLRQPWLAQQN